MSGPSKSRETKSYIQSRSSDYSDSSYYSDSDDSGEDLRDIIGDYSFFGFVRGAFGMFMDQSSTNINDSNQTDSREDVRTKETVIKAELVEDDVSYAESLTDFSDNDTACSYDQTVSESVTDHNQHVIADSKDVNHKSDEYRPENDDLLNDLEKVGSNGLVEGDLKSNEETSFSEKNHSEKLEPIQDKSDLFQLNDHMENHNAISVSETKSKLNDFISVPDTNESSSKTPTVDDSAESQENVNDFELENKISIDLSEDMSELILSRDSDIGLSSDDDSINIGVSVNGLKANPRQTADRDKKNQNDQSYLEAQAQIAKLEKQLEQAAKARGGAKERSLSCATSTDINTKSSDGHQSLEVEENKNLPSNHNERDNNVTEKILDHTMETIKHPNTDINNDVDHMKSEPDNIDMGQKNDDEEIDKADDVNIDQPDDVKLGPETAEMTISNDNEADMADDVIIDQSDDVKLGPETAEMTISNDTEADMADDVIIDQPDDVKLGPDTEHSLQHNSKILNEELEIYRSDRIKDTRSTQEMVNDMFDSFKKSKLVGKDCGNTCKAVLKESNRFAQCVILRSKEPWWTCLDQIRSQKESEKKNNMMKKGRWLCKQSICSNNDVSFSMQAVDTCSDITIKPIWWNVPERESSFSQDCLSSDLRWYFIAMNKERQLQDQSEKADSFAQVAEKKRKITTIPSKTWFSIADGQETILQSLCQDSQSIVHGSNTNNSVASPNLTMTSGVPSNNDSEISRKLSTDEAILLLKHNISERINSLDVVSASSKNMISFKNNIASKPVCVLEIPSSSKILQKHATCKQDFEMLFLEPSLQIVDLIDNIMGDSISRRSNACGALKVMVSQKKNAITLGSTAGVLDALLFAACSSVDNGESYIAAVRALGAIAGLSQIPDNRRYICDCPGLLPYLVEVLKTDAGEACLQACSIVAALAKSEDNKDVIMSIDDLVNCLSHILVKLNEESVDCEEEDAREDMSTSNMSTMSSRKIEKKQKVISSARLNSCAALLHLSKKCTVSSQMCNDEKLLFNITKCAGSLSDPIGGRCMEILAHLSRLPSNAEFLCSIPGIHDAISSCGLSDNEDERIWGLRTLQNLSAFASKKGNLLTNEIVRFLCKSMNSIESEEEYSTAVAVVTNFCTDPSAVVHLTNAKGMLFSIINVANSPEYHAEVQYNACDALASMSVWIQRSARGSCIPEGFSKDALSPTLQQSGYMRYHDATAE